MGSYRKVTVTLGSDNTWLRQTRYHTLVFTLSTLMLLSGCNHLFYYPTKNLHYNPSQLNLKYEEKKIRLKNGKFINGWLFRTAKISPCKNTLLVHLHGNAQNISTHFTQMTWVLDSGLDYFIFDYPGYGRSEGEAAQDEIYHATNELLNLITSGQINLDLDIRSVVLYGQSLGGAILLGVLPDIKNIEIVNSIVIESSFISYKHIAKEKLGQSWLTWPVQWLPYLLLTDTRSGVGRLNQLKLPPTLVLMSLTDMVVPPTESEMIMRELPEPKELLTVSGARHLEILSPSFKLREELIRRFCPKSSKN